MFRVDRIMRRTLFFRVSVKWMGVLTAVCMMVLSACDNTPGNITETFEGDISTTNSSRETSSSTQVKTYSENNPETGPSDKVASSEKSQYKAESFQDIPRIPETTKPYAYFINTVDNEEIIPNIATRQILWGYALEAMSASQLWLLRNEIYARHGYVFQSKVLNDYFSCKSWYKPDPSIKEITLSETEQANINLLKNYEDRKPFALNGGNIISWDIDGDGEKDLIQFDAHGYDEYTLHVNHQSIAAVGENLMGYCSVIDLDTSDSQCEILIRSLGPSSDDSFQMYRYQDGRIQAIGQVDGFLTDVPGNGYCSIRIRASVLQTWFLLDLYRLNGEGMLSDVEQDVYPVLAEIKVINGTAILEETPCDFSNQNEDVFYSYAYNVTTMLKDLPVVNEPLDSQPTGILKHGERIVFLGSDNRKWVKIQGESGVIGWFQLNHFNDIVLDGKDYPADEFFSNLCYAD